MPIDIRQISGALNDLTRAAREEAQTRESAAEKLRRIFAPSFEADRWVATCAIASRLENVAWNGALFNLGEPVNTFVPFGAPDGAESQRYALLSADGSQILPDRHKPAPYYLIQVAGACIAYGENDKNADAIRQTEQKYTELFSSPDQLYDDKGEIKRPGEIANERDLREIEWLADQCQNLSRAGWQVMAMADGQIVPFALLNDALPPKKQREILDRLTRALERIRASGAWLAGYIDRPNSNALVRAAALADVPPDGVTAERVRKTELGAVSVFDRHILEKVLPPGFRTALFEPTWQVNNKLGAHAMRACYANFGYDSDAGHPVIARLELPEWCATPHVLSAICGAMRRHARMGAGYPFILKAAHEAALVSKDDQKQIDDLVQQSLIEAGIFAARSFKQEAKDLS